MKSKNNNYAFIDGQNFYLAVQSLEWRVDLKLFSDYLRQKQRVSKIFYFIGYDSTQKKLYRDLKEFGYTIVFKKIVYHHKTDKEGQIQITKKGNVDTHLIMQVIRELDNFHKAIIISGDGGFKPLYKWLIEKNKLYRIGIPNRHNKSHLLNQFQRYFLYLEFLREKFEYKKMGYTQSRSKLDASNPS